MSKAFDDSQYLARTLAITLLDLQPAQKHEILSYLHQELERLTHVLNEDEATLDPRRQKTMTFQTSDALTKQSPIAE